MLPIQFQENHQIQRRKEEREENRNYRYESSTSGEEGEDSDDDDDDEICTCYGCLDNLAKQSARPPDPIIFEDRDLAPIENKISALLAKVDEFIAKGLEQRKPDLIGEGLKLLEWILNAMKEFRPRKGTLNKYNTIPLFSISFI